LSLEGYMGRCGIAPSASD